MAEHPSSPSAKRIAIAIELHYALPWHHDCHQGIQQYGNEHGWACVLDPYLVGTTGEADIAGYDGVVGRLDPESAQTAKDHAIPMVSLIPVREMPHIPMVQIDSRVGVELATKHLIDSGYRRFGYIGLPGLVVGKIHFAAMNEELAAHGFAPASFCEIDGNFETGRDSTKIARQALTKWIAELTLPVGILVRQHTTARYLAQVCMEIGLRVPEEVGIVVHDGDQVTVTSTSPTLSAIDYDYFSLGYEAAAMLDKLMLGKPADPLHRRLKPKGIIVRESSDVFLCADPMVSDAMRFIAERVRESLRVEEVAEALNTSRRTLERRFEDVLGRPIYGEITRLRCDYVKRLLLETDLPLGTIASNCGFADASHFTKYVRKELGVTPSAYRKRFKDLPADKRSSPQ